MGATVGVPNTAYLDFNSLEGGANDFDSRLISVGGETGVDGRGSLAYQANEFAFVGNASNLTPSVNFSGSLGWIGSTAQFYPSVNQGRMFAAQHIVWTGQAGTAPVDPVVEIQLRDRITLTPFTGHFFITISNGWSGTGQSIYQAMKSVTSAVGSTGDQWNFANEDEGDDLSDVYVAFDLSNSSYPIMLIYNKSADPIRFIISGTITVDTLL